MKRAERRERGREYKKQREREREDERERERGKSMYFLGQGKNRCKVRLARSM